jgi:hypothetical protein
MSLGARLMNVFAAPGELFEALRQSGFSVANWLVPGTLVAFLGILSTLIVFSEPALIEQVQAMQDKAYDQAVADGKMTQEQAEQVREMMRGVGVTIMRVGGAVWMTLAAFVSPLWWAFLGWLIGRFVFRAPVGFLRLLEVTGLANLILGVGYIVGMFMQLGLGNISAGPHLATFLESFDVMNRGHLALSVANVFNLWQVVVIGLGFARFFGRPFVPVLLVWFGVWAGYKAVAVLLRLVQLAL